MKKYVEKYVLNIYEKHCHERKIMINSTVLKLLFILRYNKRNVKRQATEGLIPRIYKELL